MRMATGGSLVAAMTIAACSAPDGDLGAAAEAQCGGLYVSDVTIHDGSVYFVSPASLLDAAEAWGPQTLQVTVDRLIGTQVSYLQQPSVQVQKDKLTRTLQEATGVTLLNDVELTASSSTVVPQGAFERLEAYPEFQRITWDLREAACGVFRDADVTPGTAYRPTGVYFRIVVGQAAPAASDARAPAPAAGASTPVPIPIEASGVTPGVGGEPALPL
jgi:hypothetical protein